ncbi:MAG: 50S ribosomal protein L15e [Candidatus Diapherotrites archaeon]|uniref:50S ribosomal protein L15e n=1 Tax=Candidatus Iainarchaeum sp. TaxID=3101447 RepID=A0A8T3YPL7_9ARCH|nr:50S ribosomal protein L15e [Candidatus Diapherotrites archaeon]
MGLYKHLTGTLQKEYSGEGSKDYNYAAIYREKVFRQRNADSAVIRLERPSNIARARSLGYKAKQGFIIALSRIRKGSGMHRRPVRGRKPKRMGVTKLTRRAPRQAMAERRAGVKFPNCEVLNSYWVGEDGLNTFFEVILVDRASPAVLADSDRRWIASHKHRHRAERGLTSRGKKGRGLKKGRGHEKNFPSQRAHNRTAK